MGTILYSSITNMKIIFKDLKKRQIKLKAESLDDLWCISNVIEDGDLIKGKTIRKIRIGNKDQRSQKIIKKSIFLEIKAEKAEFLNNILKILGKITQAPDDVPIGSFHSFNVEQNDIITITKEKWLKFQLQKLEEASRESEKILILVHDREEAYFALLKKFGYEILAQIKGLVQKKGYNELLNENFYHEIVGKLEDYMYRYKIDVVIIASPSFWKEYLLSEIKDENLKKKIVVASCSGVGIGAIEEVLKRPETGEALKKDRTSKEAFMVDLLLEEISKKGFAEYGIEKVENVAISGAVKILLITDKIINTFKQEKKFNRIDTLMKIVEQQKGEIHIISSEHLGGKKLDGLGGIAAILRFKLEY